MNPRSKPQARRCPACGRLPQSGARPLRSLAKTYVVVVTCNPCGARFAALSRN
ncbi:MAG: hypothetical protein ACREM2_05655 [Vulcanimicrobiaceae bacterium]